MGKDVAQFSENCLLCTMVEDRKPASRAPLLRTHQRRRFEQVAIDMTTITPRTGKEKRHFQVMISGRRLSCWTSESDFPAAIVKLYYQRVAEVWIATQGEANDESEGSPSDEDDEDALVGETALRLADEALRRLSRDHKGRVEDPLEAINKVGISSIH